MLNSSLGLSATFDQAIDRASMSLDFYRLNKNTEYNERVLMAHIEKLEQLLEQQTDKYNQLVRTANSEINAIAKKFNEVSKKLDEVNIDIEKEKLNNFDLQTKVKTLSNVNRAYIYAMKSQTEENQIFMFTKVRECIEHGNKNQFSKIKI